MEQRISWNIGDILRLSPHTSKPGHGLTYGPKDVIASEPGSSGGWDVYEAGDEDGFETAFYGFSVQRNLSASTVYAHNLGRDLYRVTIWHGEAATLHCVQWINGEDPDDWDTVATYRDPEDARWHATTGEKKATARRLEDGDNGVIRAEMRAEGLTP